MEQSLMRNLMVLVLSVALVLFFQNCGGEQTFDEAGGSTNNASTSCTSETKTITIISNQNGVATFELGALDIQQTEWSIDGRVVRTENGRRFTYTFPRVGNFLVSAEGFKANCLTPAYTAEKQINIPSTGGSGPVCNSLLPMLSANPTTAQVNTAVTVTLTNAASFVASSLLWTVNGQARPDRDGQTTISLSSATAGPLDVVVSANQNCNRQETSSLRVTIGAAPGAAILNSFVLATLLPLNSNPARNTGLDAVYNLRRDSAINLALNVSDFVSATVSGNVADICSGDNCVTLNPAQTSATSCFQATRRVTIRGRNGQDLTEDFFIYCPATGVGLASASCSVGRNLKRDLNENCDQLSSVPAQCTLASSGQCSVNLRAGGLQAGSTYRLFVMNGDTLGAETRCFSTGTDNSVIDTNIPWITATPTRFRLMKGPPTSCGGEISLFKQAAADVTVSGVAAGTPTTSTTSTTQPPSEGCPPTDIGRCRLPLTNGPGYIPGTCICPHGGCDINDQCAFFCSDGAYSTGDGFYCGSSGPN
jgi:hypothetical protein